MTHHDVRPARQRDLALLEPEVRTDGPGFAMVAGDPPVALVRVRLLDGHPHVEHLMVGADLDGSVRTALLDAVCERLAARGLGQVTAAPFAGPEATTYAALGFEEVGADELVPGPLVSVRAVPGRVLMRRVLRHRAVDEVPAFLPELDALPKAWSQRADRRRQPAHH